MRIGVHFCVFLGLIAGTAWADPTLYGAAGNGSSISPGGLFTVNQANGSGTFVGDGVTPGGLSGLVFDLGGTLYGTTVSGGGSTSSLVTLNPASGAVLTSVGLGISIGDLALDPTTNTLYGIRSNADGTGNGGLLYSITSGGVVTLIGSTGQGRGGGLAFDVAGNLYFLEFNQLHTLDKTTGGLLSTANLGTALGEGLAIRPSDGLLFSTSAGNNQNLWTLNADGSNITLLGATGNGSLSDLAFTPVPEPASMVLFGVALAAAAYRRRRRS